MNWVITALLVVVGLINFLPLMGVISADKLAALYSVNVGDANMELLLRHRAVLFGILGGFIIVAAFVPSWQWLAIVGGLLSMVSFIVLAQQIGDYNAEIRKIILIDWAAIACTIVAAVLKWFTHE